MTDQITALLTIAVIIMDAAAITTVIIVHFRFDRRYRLVSSRAEEAIRLASSAIVSARSSRSSRFEEDANADDASLRRAHSTAAACLDLSNFKAHSPEVIIDRT